MTQLRLTKAQVLKAIREEPLLVPGSWSIAVPGSGPRGARIVGDDQYCQVCAVGAVLRKVLDPAQSLSTIGVTATRNVGTAYSAVPKYTVEAIYASGQEVLAMENEGPWSALSHVFESLGVIHRNDIGEMALPQIREDLLVFAERYFPEDLTLRVPDEYKVTDFAKVVAT